MHNGLITHCFLLFFYIFKSINFDSSSNHLLFSFVFHLPVMQLFGSCFNLLLFIIISVTNYKKNNFLHLHFMLLNNYTQQPYKSHHVIIPAT
jgi:hypothetical protein